jgi:hypothetical protein
VICATRTNAPVVLVGFATLSTDRPEISTSRWRSSLSAVARVVSAQ